MPLAWRIVKRKHAASALDGEGARLYGGRWNPRGVPMVSLAESRALALLEVLVHVRDDSVVSSYVSIRIEFEEGWCEPLPASSLPGSWWESPAPPELSRIGEEWIRSGRSLLLAVPSAVVPSERLFLLNPSHRDARRLVIGRPEDFRLDRRLK